VRDRDKPAMVELGRLLLERGYRLIATGGTAAYLRRGGLEIEGVNKVHQGRPHIVDRIKNGDIAIVLNTTEGRRAIRDSYTLRRAALMHKIPYYTTLAGARAVVQAMTAPTARDLAVAPLQSYY
jgi:carbamoyl-phosphate synthase large subunit